MFKALNILWDVEFQFYFIYLFLIQNINFTVYSLYSSKENNFKKIPGWKSFTATGSAGKDSLLGFLLLLFIF